MTFNIFVDRSFRYLLSEESKHKIEATVIWLCIASFAIHLLFIIFVKFGVIQVAGSSQLLTDPISAIYTPFSFILLFEVYLLVYHIPQSTTTYIGKQYEIITLIVVRRLFKDIARIDLSSDWFQDTYDLQFTYDIVTTLILFLLIYFFHKLSQKPHNAKPIDQLPEKIQLFIKRKRAIALALVPIFILLAAYSFGNWVIDAVKFMSDEQTSASFININNIFFDEFFVVLILTDVLLLLFSFFHTTQFNLFIRNSGFIISTILLRLSFRVEGYMNNVLIISAVLFGVLILFINRKYEKPDTTEL